MQQAKEKPGKACTFAWILKETSYRLTIIQQVGAQDPQWTLFKSERGVEKLVWEYRSPDPILLYNLVVKQCTGEEARITKSNLMAMSIPLALTSPDKPALNELHPTQAADVRPPRPKGSTHMEGTLTDMPVPSLLQLIGMSPMSGVLAISGIQGAGEVIFQSGRLVHAEAPGLSGEKAVSEMCTWEEGSFEFIKETRQVQQTIHREPHAIILDGIALLDQMKYLARREITQDTPLSLNEPFNLDPVLFVGVVGMLNGSDPGQLQNIYAQLKNGATMFEVGTRVGLAKPDLLRIMYHLLNNKIISKREVKVESVAIDRPPDYAVKIDPNAIQSVEKILTRPESGLYSYPAFLYLLKQEFDRFQCVNTPLSVILLEVAVIRDGQVVELTREVLSQIYRRISWVKRRMDIFAHFETLEYALLLPSTQSAVAGAVAQRIYESLMQKALAPDIDYKTLRLALGIASIPEHSSDPELLLGEARLAKNFAKTGKKQIVVACPEFR